MNFSRKILVFVIVGFFIGTSILPRIQNNALNSFSACSKEIIDSNQEDNFDFLIISPYEFNNSLNPLIEHKNNHGINTRIVNLEDINMNDSRDKQEEIKYFIKESIEKHNVSYVLLIGDREKFPVRYSYTGMVDGIEPFISDLYYADIYDENGDFCNWDANNNNKFGEVNKSEMIDKMDLYPDVYLGRLLCSNISELNTIVNKIINYEENTYGKEWFNNIILCGGDTYPGMLLTLLNHSGYEGEIVCDEVKQIMNDFTPTSLYASAMLPSFLRTNSNDTTFLTYEKINNAINKGAGFVLFSGHGTPEGWMTNAPLFRNLLFLLTCYQSYLINELNNEDKLPIVVFDACSCGDFSENTGVSSPIAWDFVKKQDGGAIACIASTTISWGTVGKHAKDFTCGYFTTKLFESTTTGYLGKMVYQAQNQYMNSFPLYNHQDCLTIEAFTLFGDPSLRIGGYS